jgi:predicted ribosomally synthesized peptide with nif11-like leader
MSIEDLTAFVSMLEGDDTLRERAFALHDAAAGDSIDGLCRLAGERGLDVTPDDWKHEAASSAIAALDDESLRRVVGGAGCDAPGYTSGGQHGDGPAMGL